MQNSFTEENYLKIIHSLSGIDKLDVSTNALAEKTDTKAASVTDMLRKLSAKGLVHYQKYRGVRLTDEGDSKALMIIRRHRLWEVFLVEKLGFSWDQVHEIAEELEHISSETLVEKLDAFLGRPQFDPHGDPIPDKKGELPGNSFVKLSELAIGLSGIIMGVTDHSTTFLQYLDDLGIRLGLEIKIQKINEYDKACFAEIGNKSFFLTFDAASHLMIQPLKADAS